MDITRNKKVVTRSSCHTEYIALAEATDEVIFLIGIAKDLSLNISEHIEIFEDNSSAKVFVRFRLLMLFFCN